MRAVGVLFSFLAACGLGAAPLENAELRVTRMDGASDVSSRRLVAMPDGARRLTVPVREIARDVGKIDVVLDAAVQPKDERGWWVIGDGRYGKMTRERGSLKSNRERMALFGMSVPSVTWCAIVKGLRLEYECHVEAKDGVYTVFPRFEIAGIEFDPYEDIVIDFYELNTSSSRRRSSPPVTRTERKSSSITQTGRSPTAVGRSARFRTPCSRRGMENEGAEPHRNCRGLGIDAASGRRTGAGVRPHLERQGREGAHPGEGRADARRGVPLPGEDV